MVRYSGAVINVTATYNNHHVEHWSSSPTIGQGNSKFYVTNILLVQDNFGSSYQG